MSVTLQQSVSSGVGLVVPGDRAPEVTVLPVPRHGDASTTSTTWFSSIIEEGTSANTWNDWELIPQLNRSLTLESGDESVAIINGNTAERVSDGLVAIYAKGDGPTRRRVVLDFTASSGTFRHLTGFVEGSVQAYFHEPILSALASGGSANYFSTVNHSTQTYTPNPNCWAASVNLSAVSVANNVPGPVTWGHQRAGVAVTPRHVLVADHFPLYVGNKLRFRGSDGSIIERTVIGAYGETQAGVAYDNRICVLDSDLPASVAPMSLAGEWIRSEAEPVGSNTYHYIGGFFGLWIDQLKNVYAAPIGASSAKSWSVGKSGTLNGDDYVELASSLYSSVLPAEIDASVPLTTYSTFTKNPVAGDSGSPVMVWSGSGAPLLVMNWLTNVNGPFAGRLNGEILNHVIELADSNAGISTGYTVTVALDPTA